MNELYGGPGGLKTLEPNWQRKEVKTALFRSLKLNSLLKYHKIKNFNGTKHEQTKIKENSGAQDKRTILML